MRYKAGHGALRRAYPAVGATLVVAPFAQRVPLTGLARRGNRATTRVAPRGRHESTVIAFHDAPISSGWLNRATSAMWRLSYLASVVCLASALAQQSALVRMVRPHEGTISNAIYTNKYFDLSYPLPSGWMEGMAGPAPSQSGHYVLSTLMPVGEPAGSILIAAQDTFFAAKAFRDPMSMAHEVRRTMAALPDMTIDREPEEETISGRTFSRVDFSGVGLFRSTWITEIRCHLVSFNLMANKPELLAALKLSLSNIAHVGDRAADNPDPVCLSNYANAENLLTKVDPEAIGPTFVPIPIRIIISADGSVKHVHVIRATVEQRNSIERALAQWKFRPREMDGRAAEIETGVLIEFRPGGVVRYSAG